MDTAAPQHHSCFSIHSTGLDWRTFRPIHKRNWSSQKQGLQSFSEGHPYMLKQNFPWQTCREWFIKLCACGPDFAALNEYPAIDSIVHCHCLMTAPTTPSSECLHSLQTRPPAWCGVVQVPVNNTPASVCWL